MGAHEVLCTDRKMDQQAKPFVPRRQKDPTRAAILFCAASEGEEGTMKITVGIAPMGAVRMTQRGKYKDPVAQRYLNYKNYIGWAVRDQIKQAIDAPISVRMTFYYRIPDAWPKWKKKAALEGKIRPIVKPDIDNVVKGCFDALNGIAWKDDNRVVEESSSKWYSDHPRIEIEIEEWSHEETA